MPEYPRHPDEDFDPEYRGHVLPIRVGQREVRHLTARGLEALGAREAAARARAEAAGRLADRGIVDRSYAEALAAAAAPRLGPVPCKGCQRPVEWAGVVWLTPGTDEPHRCRPAWDGEPARMAHKQAAWRSLARVQPRSAGSPGFTYGPQQARRVEDLPAWVDSLGLGLLLILAALVAVAILAQLGGWSS